MSTLIPAPLDTIRVAYEELGHHVTTTLQIQRGDTARLAATQQECLLLLEFVDQVCAEHIIFPAFY